MISHMSLGTERLVFSTSRLTSRARHPALALAVVREGFWLLNVVDRRSLSFFVRSSYATNKIMASTDYLWEKVMTAVDCLASGAGSFESRLYNAHVSALTRLDLRDPPPELADDLRWVLELCQRHQTPDRGGMAAVSESDRHKLVEKLIHILIVTSRLTV